MKKINTLMTVLCICLLQSACLGKVATETIPNPETIRSTSTSADISGTEINQTATLASPSPTLPPDTLSAQTTQPIPCDIAEFVSDVTVVDGTVFKPGELFTKIWRLKNIGSCTWTTNYALVFQSGDSMSAAESQNLPNDVSPGQSIDVTTYLTAPSQPGRYKGYWQLQNTSGERLLIKNGSTDSLFYVDIVVAADTAAFSISVESLVITCDKPDVFTATATIVSTGDGSVLYHWGTDGVQPYPAETIAFQGSTKTAITKDIPFAAVDPNHPEWNNIYFFILEPQKIRTEVLRQCP